MISKDVIAKIRKIEIKTRKLLAGNHAGDYLTKQRGYGLEFEQLNEYQLGDDIRFVDWKSSARFNKMLIKEYRDEKSRTLLIAIDISQSSFFGSQYGSKHDLITQIAAILAFVGYYSNDSVGLVLFSDSIELYIPPSKGKKHVNMLLEKIFNIKPLGKKTSLARAFHFIGALKKRDCCVFLISDFLDDKFDKELLHLALHYEVFALRCLDYFEMNPPCLGFIECRDIETGAQLVIDTRSKSLKNLGLLIGHMRNDQERLFKSGNIPFINMSDNKLCIEQLVKFFRARS